jgi:signal transduction histidine kinase/DNA-binding response OmpR family regulator
VSAGVTPLLPDASEDVQGELSTLRILVVDDDEVDRLIVHRGLHRANVRAELVDADSEAEALRCAADGSYDCVLLDYNIPGTDGLTMLGRLQQVVPGTPIIMLTGQGDEQVAVQLMKAGAVDYLPKSAVTPERLAASVRYAVELTRASVLAQQASQELRESAERARFLAEASAVLTRSLDPRETIAEVARLAVPFIADYCVIYGVDQDGNPAPVSGAHHDAELQRHTTLIAQQHQPHRDHPRSPVAAAIRTGEVVVIDDVNDEFLATLSCSEEVLVAFQKLDPAWIAVFPLAARQRIRGAMAFGRTAARTPFSPAEIELAQDLAQRTALAFDNAGLYEAAEQARARTERLQQATAALARALPQDQVAELFVSQARDALSADTAWVALLSGDATELYAVAHIGFAPDDIAPWLRFASSTPAPSRDVLNDGRDRWYGTKEELFAAYPSLQDIMQSMPQEALGVLALDAGGGRLGVMTIGFRDARVFAEEDRGLACALASQCAQALERARLYEAERDARERAELANRAKSEFLARMSHDLRTPLNAIGGYAELVEMGLRGPVTAEQQEAMSRIQRAKDHLLTLINDILSFAKLEAGQVTIHVEQVPVVHIVNELRPLVEQQISAKGLQWQARGSNDVIVSADRERLVQILVNLLTNAIKFTDEGTVALEWEKQDAHVLLHVSDTGCGIPADRLAVIFDPFVQAGASTTGEREGVGLGLAISRELARLMGGTLMARSTVDEGSVFTVRMPSA